MRKVIYTVAPTSVPSNTVNIQVLPVCIKNLFPLFSKNTKQSSLCILPLWIKYGVLSFLFIIGRAVDYMTALSLYCQVVSKEVFVCWFKFARGRMVDCFTAELLQRLHAAVLKSLPLSCVAV